MKFHREGYRIIAWTIGVVVVLNVFNIVFFDNFWINFAVGFITAFVLIAVLQFFRNPNRPILQKDDSLLYAPADGKVVVIEEAEENEYFQGKRLQISIFMSPLNVHVNRYPTSGVVRYCRYHEGQYLVAWHPKSSTENERTTVVLGNERGEVLLRQIAGAVARRIIVYAKVGERVEQGGELGFIRFGSRVDVFLPLDAAVKVKIGDVVKGNQTVLASW